MEARNKAVTHDVKVASDSFSTNNPLSPKEIFADYESYLAELGYTQFIHSPISPNTPALQTEDYTIGPVSEGVFDGVFDHINKKMIGRLFADQENRLFVLSLRKLYEGLSVEENIDDPAVFKPLPDGVFSWMLVLIKNVEKNWEQQLRVAHCDNGHIQLIFKEEYAALVKENNSIHCIIGAGEAYYNHFMGGFVMINNKTGNFHAELSKLNLDYEAIVNNVFSSFYSPEIPKVYFAASDKDIEVVNALVERGFPHSLMSYGMRKNFPLTTLSPALVEKNELNESHYLKACQAEIIDLINMGRPYSCLTLQQKQKVLLTTLPDEIQARNINNEQFKRMMIDSIVQGTVYMTFPEDWQQQVPLNTLEKDIRDQAYRNMPNNFESMTIKDLTPESGSSNWPNAKHSPRFSPRRGGTAAGKPLSGNKMVFSTNFFARSAVAIAESIPPAVEVNIPAEKGKQLITICKPRPPSSF